MTNNLHTRIAAVLYRQHYRYGNPNDITWDELETDLKDRYLADADAVIRELKLHVVTAGDFQTVIKGSYPKPLEDT